MELNTVLLKDIFAEVMITFAMVLMNVVILSVKVYSAYLYIAIYYLHILYKPYDATMMQRDNCQCALPDLTEHRILFLIRTKQSELKPFRQKNTCVNYSSLRTHIILFSVINYNLKIIFYIWTNQTFMKGFMGYLTLILYYL